MVDIDREKIKKLVKDILEANVDAKVQMIQDLQAGLKPESGLWQELYEKLEFINGFISEYCEVANIDRATLGTVAVSAEVEEDPNEMYKIRIVRVKKQNPNMARTFLDLSHLAKSVFPPGVGSTLIKKEAVTGLFETPIKPLDIDYSMLKAEALTASQEFAAIDLEVTLVKA